MSSIGGVTSAVSAGLLRQADQDVAVSATLLKKAMQSDKDMVATLLPSLPSASGSLDIRA